MVSKADQDKKDRELFKEYHIFFRGPGEEWPIHHEKSFSKILALGSTPFSTYSDNETESHFWKSETKAHAKQLVEVVSRLVGNQPSEIKWRLDLEAIIYKRFERDIECPERQCKRRWWRSEIEVVSENEGPITTSIKRRRETRAACICDPKTRLQHQNGIGLNRVFENRADELVLYGGDVQSPLRQRKPDRVYGLAHSRKFDRSLQEAAAAIQKRAVEGSSMTGNTNMVQSTPFEEQARPLLFPFLISESKSERGHSFDSCARQTAFPIWKLLRLQEQLQVEAKSSLVEQGGPLVWFFANRGEDWRLYGCYTDKEENADDVKSTYTSYNILCLWSGRVDSQDGALQVLLLVDYIFDWARDLYRSGILSLLKLVPRDGLIDSASISTDSEIHSLDYGLQTELPHSKSLTQKVELWQEQLQSLDTCAQNQQLPDRRATLLEQWRTSDTLDGVFRHASAIESCFQSVLLTRDSIANIYAGLMDRGCSKAFLQAYSRGLLAYSSFTISDSVLSSVEEQWTGKRRTFEHHEQPATANKYAFITYYIHIYKKWQPRRVLACVTFDQSAIVELQEWANCTRSIPRERKDWQLMRPISMQELELLIKHLKELTMRDNLAAALECKSSFLTKVSVGLETGFKFCASHIHHFSEFSTQVADLYSKEAIQPFFNSSSHTENQGTALANKEMKDIPSSVLDCYPNDNIRRHLEDINHILVWSKDIRKIACLQEPGWCIFSLSHTVEPLKFHEQYKTIVRFPDDIDRYVITSHLPNKINLNNTCRHVRASNGGNVEVIRALLKWSAKLRNIVTIRSFRKVVLEQRKFILASCMKRRWSGDCDSRDDSDTSDNSDEADGSNHKVNPKRTRLGVLEPQQEIKRESI